MQERKAAFDKKFRNVWNVGPTGVSYFEFSLPDRQSANNLIMKMFKKTLAADVEVLTNTA